MSGFFERLDPILKLLPEVRRPETTPTLKTRLIYSALALILFFAMGQVALIGLTGESEVQSEALQTILASDIGSLITVGIGPIVLASIILQLLVGGGFLKIDLSIPENKARFTAAQKLLAIILSFFEGAAFLGFGVQGVGFLTAAPGMFLFVVLQIAVGSIILMYLDELVSKWGIGSGIGLFIAGGVSQGFFWQVFRPADAFGSAGRIFTIGQALLEGNAYQAFVGFLPIIFVLLIFLVIVFAEGMHVNIPIAMGQTGAGGRFPVKLLYVSNMPVILAAALFANIQLWAAITQSIPVANTITSGLAWATSYPQVGGGFSLLEGLLTLGITSSTGMEVLQALVYILLLVGACVVFGRFWIELGGQGSKAVSEQLDRSGMSIPGFRRDPRIMQKVLDRYIPHVTILGSIFVGLLAGLSDITTASLVSGTGVLLTVGIVYRLYEELAKAQLMDLHPALKGFFGEK
ncbi:MAG: preprotein translocase subunit SecY [Candidatus Diapherotrites archaeon]|nr:preprotein translocase subunit SecY [Candidatus Diapherotrites archaeon]MDZ4256020.1 preprotein translocase subunit SecY [archaeon]